MGSISKAARQLRILSRRNSFLVNVIDSTLPQQPITSAAIDSTPTTSKTHDQLKNDSAPSSLKHPELAKFSAIADTWRDSEGPFKPLHVMNPTRLAFIRSTLCRHFRKDPYSGKPFEGLNIVDVGSGGGILSEPLARMGATVIALTLWRKISRSHAFMLI